MIGSSGKKSELEDLANLSQHYRSEMIILVLGATYWSSSFLSPLMCSLLSSGPHEFTGGMTLHVCGSVELTYPKEKPIWVL